LQFEANRYENPANDAIITKKDNSLNKIVQQLLRKIDEKDKEIDQLLSAIRPSTT